MKIRHGARDLKDSGSVLRANMLLMLLASFSVSYARSTAGKLSYDAMRTHNGSEQLMRLRCESSKLHGQRIFLKNQIDDMSLAMMLAQRCKKILMRAWCIRRTRRGDKSDARSRSRSHHSGQISHAAMEGDGWLAPCSVRAVSDAQVHEDVSTVNQLLQLHKWNDALHLLLQLIADGYTVPEVERQCSVEVYSNVGACYVALEQYGLAAVWFQVNHSLICIFFSTCHRLVSACCGSLTTLLRGVARVTNSTQCHNLRKFLQQF